MFQGTRERLLPCAPLAVRSAAVASRLVQSASLDSLLYHATR